MIFYYFAIKELDNITFSQWQYVDYDSIDIDDSSLDAKPDTAINCGNTEFVFFLI